MPVAEHRAQEDGDSAVTLAERRGRTRKLKGSRPAPYPSQVPGRRAEQRALNRGESPAKRRQHTDSSSGGHHTVPRLTDSVLPRANSPARGHNASKGKVAGGNGDVKPKAASTATSAAPGDRLLMRAWLEQRLNIEDVEGFTWMDKSHTMFKMAWIHGSRQGWNSGHAQLFMLWASHTGKYDPDHLDPKKWKANFRCALNSLPDVEEVTDLSKKRGENAFKVYRMLPTIRRRTIATRKNTTGRHRNIKTEPKGRSIQQEKVTSSTCTQTEGHSQGAWSDAASDVEGDNNNPCSPSSSTSSTCSSNIIFQTPYSAVLCAAQPHDATQRQNDIAVPNNNDSQGVHYADYATGANEVLQYCPDSPNEPQQISSGDHDYAAKNPDVRLPTTVVALEDTNMLTWENATQLVVSSTHPMSAMSLDGAYSNPSSSPRDYTPSDDELTEMVSEMMDGPTSSPVIETMATSSFISTFVPGMGHPICPSPVWNDMDLTTVETEVGYEPAYRELPASAL